MGSQRRGHAQEINTITFTIYKAQTCMLFFFLIRKKDLQGWDSDSFTTCTVSNALRQKKVEGLLPLCS